MLWQEYSFVFKKVEEKSNSVEVVNVGNQIVWNKKMLTKNTFCL